jgi:hypothetical protein
MSKPLKMGLRAICTAVTLLGVSILSGCGHNETGSTDSQAAGTATVTSNGGIAGGRPTADQAAAAARQRASEMAAQRARQQH